MKIIELYEIDSTNEYCKRNYAGRPFVVTAQIQTEECATDGRSFLSGQGGLYLSVVRNPYKLEAADAFMITASACTAVCRTLESYGLNSVIRWGNDIFVNGKKICRILVENTFSGSFVSRSIIGITININNKLPEDFLSTATTVKEQAGREIAVDKFRNMLLENINKKFTIADYKSYIDWLGKNITVKTASGEHAATAVDIDADGRLICILAGSLKKISPSEVSIEL